MGIYRNLLHVKNVRPAGMAAKFLLLNMISATMFSVIYYLCGRFIDNKMFINNVKLDIDNNNATDYISYFRCLHFSLVTQSTIGYGDLTCNSYLGVTINMLQALSTFLISGYILYLN